MRLPRVLIFENDGRVARLFEHLKLQSKVWTIHELRRIEECIEFLRSDGPCVLIVKLGRNLEQELELLERIGRWFPDTTRLVFSETPYTALTELCWDLGASAVVVPPQSCNVLPELAAVFLGVRLVFQADEREPA